ncbi:tetratricopeptide repeat protein [Rugamonas rivuli]|uniref:Tetratricopeptide repeat protein n=1 Tax=Rugamonas rivuli TaxID=2743358 RepID=A0A843SE05_9BURK|nr:tetratricopeptide repeat protein [Rugamonas rivuli]MQA18897.1 tetratricopeptide repeat protein [Rugamonas rivuli]
MSLLMQALKKAERAKQSSGADDETDKPSQAFDEILALTPEPAPAPAPAAQPGLGMSLDLEPMSGLSLEPIPAEPAAASGQAPQPSPDPLPTPSDHKGPGLTLDLMPDPSAPPAAAPAATAAAAPSPAHAAKSAASPEPAPAYASAAAPAPAPAASAAKAAAGNTPRANKAGPSSTDQPRGAARARAAAAATAPTESAGLDRDRLRLIGWIALLVLVAAGMGYYYWQAVLAPGAGSRLPPVPMPPIGATGATSVKVAVAPGAIEALPDGAPIAPPAPARTGTEDLERRLNATEQALVASQQIMQQQLAQLNQPRPDQLPPIAAPDNSEIRVARASQQPVLAPALESGYQALNSGDLPLAQQQYEAALRDAPTSRDALLGLATVAARKGQGEQAAGYYLRLLELDPNDSTAVAGLVGVRQGDSGQSEARLRNILNTSPDAAPVLFALGNLQSQQGRWPEAQQSYFRAYTAMPDNADYAYNLAVGLDRLNQPKLAMKYYQRALALAQDHAAAFDRNALRLRLHELGASAR